MGTPTKDTSLGLLENVLLAIVWTGLALILVTPFIVTTETTFPFVVGKALYSRTLIELTAGCWALLALLNPTYRPPYSRLLLLLAVVLGISVLAACFGVSMQRSLWSNYERMQGLVDLAHWSALAVVLASVVRTHWRLLLNLNLGGGLAMALLVIALDRGVHVPFYSDVLAIYPNVPAPQRPPPGFDLDRRAFATLGNPTYLSAYMLVHFVVGVGFLARSFVPVAPTTPTPVPRKRGKQRRQALPAGNRSRAMLWGGRLFWGTAALLSLWAIFLSGSLGGLVGLGAALAFLAVAYAAFARTRPVQRVAYGAGFLICAILLALILFLALDNPQSSSGPLPLLKRLEELAAFFVNPYEDAPKATAAESVSVRLATYGAGLAGFAARPLLGWGPENFIVVFGRYVEGAVNMEIHDYAHAKLVEVLATTGVLGLLGYLAIWLFLFCAMLRAAKEANSKDQTLILFVSAALVGYFVQKQTLFDTATSSLQYTLLLAFFANLEAPKSGGKSRMRQAISLRLNQFVARSPVATGHWPLATGHWTLATGHWTPPVLALAVMGLVGAGLNTNRSIHATARAFDEILHEEDLTIDRTVEHFEWLAAEFEPLANIPRLQLFKNVERQWRDLHNGNEAQKLLALVDAQAAQAVRSEPENWQIHGALAELYEAVAATNPAYREHWMRHLKKSRVLMDSADYTVYLLESSLLFANKGMHGCGEEPKGAASDVRVFVDMYPVDASDLQGARVKHGFENVDFAFWRNGFEIGSQCLYKVEFPPYAIDYIHTGQHVPGVGSLSDERFNFRR